jgi:hypothetical protein
MLVLLLACSHAPCEGLAAGAARDQCLLRRIDAEARSLAPAELADTVALVGDPALRARAVSEWAGHRHARVTDAERDALCGLLADADRPACQQRLSPR